MFSPRVILIVLDSVGIGAMPDAARFGDAGAHTLGNIFSKRGKLALSNLYQLGLSHITDSRLPAFTNMPVGCFGRAAEQTGAKDTTSGHWELAGLPMAVPFRTFPNGFPGEFMRAFEERIGRDTLCNRVASGTQIITELGDEHVITGKPIVYTSADSVFQVAAHEDVISVDELYAICQTARDMLTGDLLVGRVIARPFIGSSGAYERTMNRKDFAIPPPGDTILDALCARGLTTVGIGKIEDIFFHRGISVSDHTHTNAEGIEATLHFLKDGAFDFLFVNLVDFDMLYGHRNNVEGYAQALEFFDARLPDILAALRENDVLIITADHGCDPTYPGTDHTREYIPLIVTGPPVASGIDIGTRKSFADVGATIFEYLTHEAWPVGSSFLRIVLK